MSLYYILGYMISEIWIQRCFVNTNWNKLGPKKWLEMAFSMFEFDWHPKNGEHYFLQHKKCLPTGTQPLPGMLSFHLAFNWMLSRSLPSWPSPVALCMYIVSPIPRWLGPLISLVLNVWRVKKVCPPWILVYKIFYWSKFFSLLNWIRNSFRLKITSHL